MGVIYTGIFRICARKMIQIKVFGIVLVLLFMGKYIECDVLQQSQPGPSSLYCSDLNPQNNVDIDQVRFFINAFF